MKTKDSRERLGCQAERACRVCGKAPGLPERDGCCSNDCEIIHWQCNAIVRGFCTRRNWARRCDQDYYGGYSE